MTNITEQVITLVKNHPQGINPNLIVENLGEEARKVIRDLVDEGVLGVDLYWNVFISKI